MSEANTTVRNMLVIGFIAVAVAFVLMLVRGISGTGGDHSRTASRHDIDVLKKTDSSLLLNVKMKIINPSIGDLSALAVDGDDNIYVGGETAVEMLDINGVHVHCFVVAESVRCLSISPYGEILVGLSDHVEVYHKNGGRKAAWESPASNAVLTSIASTSNYVYVADCMNKIVWLYSVSGELLGRVGEKDADKRKVGFVVPSAFFDVAIARDGSLWAANPGQHRLEHYTSDGRFISYWGRPGLDAEGFCGCCNPSNFALMPDGSFVTSEKHIVRVKVYDSECKLKGIISGQEEWNKDALGLDLAVDSKGRIFVLDPQNGRVRIYSRNCI